jgi:hypothetical protein
VPNFAELIGKMRAYSNDENAVFSGGVAAGSPIGYTGGGAGVASSATLGGATFAGATSGGADANETTANISSSSPTGDTFSNTDKIPIDNNGEDAVLGENNISPLTMGAVGIGAVVVGSIAAKMLKNYLQRKGTLQDTMTLDKLEIDKAFYEKYGIDKTELLMMPASPERDKLINEYNATCKAVEVEMKKNYKDTYDNCWKEMGKFSWEDVYKSEMTKQRFVAITAEITNNNQGVLPTCTMSDDKNYYFYAQNSNEVYKVAKDGSEMFRIQMNPDYNYEQDFRDRLSGYAEEKRDPKEMMFLAQQKDAKRYEINSDGSNRYIDVDLRVSNKSKGLLNPKWTLHANAEYISNDAPLIYFEKQNGEYVSNFKFGRTELGGKIEGYVEGSLEGSLGYKAISANTQSVGVDVGVASGSVAHSEKGTTVEGRIGSIYANLTTNEGSVAEVGLGVSKNFGKNLGGKVGAFAGQDGVGGSGSVSANTPLGSVSGSAKLGAKDFDLKADMSTHDGTKLLSQFSPELEKQIKNDLLGNENIVQHYEEKIDNPKLEKLVTSYRASNEEQSKIIAAELAKSEQFFQARKSMGNYHPQAELIDIENEIHISDISEAPKVEDSKLGFFQKAGKEAGIIGITSK